MDTVWSFVGFEYLLNKGIPVCKSGKRENPNCMDPSCGDPSGLNRKP